MAQTLNIGMIGYGFMARTHSNAYRKVNNFFDVPYQPVLKTVCGLVDAEAKSFAAKWGYESSCTDWRKVVESKDIDIIEICVPNNLHAQIAIAAAKAGKMIICEKPLALNSEQALTMVEAVEKAGVANLVSFNYRRVPAVTLAKQLIDQGRLGKIFHYRANFLQDWTISTEVPQGGMATWRLDVKAAGSGVTGDLLAHCIDTAMWQNGPITKVNAMTETFVKERKSVESGKVEPVGIDDACTFFCRFGNGSLQLRIHALCPRPQGAVHLRDQRREGLDPLGPARPAPPAVFRPPRREHRARLALGARDRRRPAVHEALVGAGVADRLRAHVRAPGGRLPRRPGQRQARVADVPRGPGDAARLRRGAGQRQERHVGGCEAMMNVATDYADGRGPIVVRRPSSCPIHRLQQPAGPTRQAGPCASVQSVADGSRFAHVRG